MIWFCHPVEIPPQGCALALVQGNGLPQGSRQGWDPHSWVLVWRHRGCHRPTTQPGRCEWGSSGIPTNQYGGRRGCWVCSKAFPPLPLDFGAARKVVTPTNLRKNPRG